MNRNDQQSQSLNNMIAQGQQIKIRKVDQSNNELIEIKNKQTENINSDLQKELFNQSIIQRLNSTQTQREDEDKDQINQQSDNSLVDEYEQKVGASHLFYLTNHHLTHLQSQNHNKSNQKYFAFQNSSMTNNFQASNLSNYSAKHQNLNQQKSQAYNDNHDESQQRQLSADIQSVSSYKKSFDRKSVFQVESSQVCMKA